MLQPCWGRGQAHSWGPRRHPSASLGLGCLICKRRVMVPACPTGPFEAPVRECGCPGLCTRRLCLCKGPAWRRQPRACPWRAELEHGPRALGATHSQKGAGPAQRTHGFSYTTALPAEQSQDGGLCRRGCPRPSPTGPQQDQQQCCAFSGRDRRDVCRRQQEGVRALASSLHTLGTWGRGEHRTSANAKVTGLS